MPIGRTKAGMAKHVSQIMSVWGGKEATHRIVAEEIDDMGNIIDRSYTDTTIYGIISPAKYKDNNYPIGSLQPGDLTALFKYSDSVRLPDQLTATTTQHSHIIYEGVEHRIESVEYAYDILVSQTSHEAVFGNYLLRKIEV